MSHRKRLAAALVAATAAAVAVPAAAQAHVTLQPKTAEAGAYTVLNVRVPNEDDRASTTKVVLQLPAGFAAASYEPHTGWRVQVRHAKLATPVQTDDGPVTDRVSRITWTGTGHGSGKIGPGEYMDFGLSVQVPGKAGDVLTFKALQTYSNGEIVRWIGAPDSEHPAPQVTVTAPAATASANSGSGTTAPPASTSSSSSGGDSSTLGVIGLIVGGFALVGGVAAFAASRRGPGAQRRTVAGNA